MINTQLKIPIKGYNIISVEIRIIFIRLQIIIIQIIQTCVYVYADND